MKKQTIFAMFLVICYSITTYSQTTYKTRTKADFAIYFNRASEQTTSSYPAHFSRENNIAGNGQVDIYAVVVGVGQYQIMPQLAYPASDAGHFYNELTSLGGGAIPRSHIYLLQDGNATADNVFGALRDVASTADGNDVVIFYFSGHGLSDAFLPVDYDGTSNRLSHRQIVQILESCRAKHKICIADACYSGNLSYNLTGKGIEGNNTVIRSLYSAFENSSGGIALLLSSSAREASWEDSGLQEGVFTYYLVEGMGGAADYDHDHIVNLSELYHYVYYKVRWHTGKHQTPVLAGNFDNEMPLAITR